VQCAVDSGQWAVEVEKATCRCTECADLEAYIPPEFVDLEGGKQPDSIPLGGNDALWVGRKLKKDAWKSANRSKSRRNKVKLGVFCALFAWFLYTFPGHICGFGGSSDRYMQGRL